jgi:lipopolysaccharide/colanic/teichoic acid biosynthesis glycosyltransferase
MTGNFIIAYCTASQPQYTNGARGSSEPLLASHARSAAALLNESAAVPWMPDHQEDSAAFNQGEWEKVSLAIHRLRTNGLHYRLAKRLLDVSVACTLMPCLVPLLLVSAVMVKMSSPGPVLYRQKRIGRFGSEFTLWKFRTMYRNSDEILRNHLETNPESAREWKQTRKLRKDPRVTRLGSILRRASLDELPQFLNVLAGSMSLVGPRPIVAAEKAHYGDAYFFYTSAKPGLSGLWQVSGRSDLSYDQRVNLDAEYIRQWNLALDIKILWRTGAAVWASKGAI